MGMSKYPTSYTFTSRYGQIRSVTQVDPKRFVVEGETLYMRFGSDEATGFTMADFEGGPCVMSGDTLEEDIDAVIAIAKPEKPRLPTNSPKPTPTNIPTTPPKVQNPVLFNNVMFLEENKKSVNKTPVQATKLKVEQSPAEREQIKNKLKNMFKLALK